MKLYVKISRYFFPIDFNISDLFFKKNTRRVAPCWPLRRLQIKGAAHSVYVYHIYTITMAACGYIMTGYDVIGVSCMFILLSWLFYYYYYNTVNIVSSSSQLTVLSLNCQDLVIDLIRLYLSRGNSLIKRHILKQTIHNIPQSPGREMKYSDSDVLHIKQSYLPFLQEQMSEVLLVKLVKL